ncbi:MAG: hypothetical protein AAF431_02955 [Pseudomonadota bacterium]
MTKHLASISIFLSMSASLASHASQHDLIGTAVNLKTNVPLYTEHHSFAEENGETVMTTRYTTPDNRLLAERKVAYEGDRVNRYELIQEFIDHQESVAREQQSLTIRENRQGVAKQKTIDVDDEKEVIIDAGFNNFIERNWDQLLDGKTLKAHFASPARMSVVKLQISRAPKKEQQDNTVVFEMTAANPIIRLLIKPVEIGFYTSSKQLAFYKGVSNLRDESREYFNVKISFDEQQAVSSPTLAAR